MQSPFTDFLPANQQQELVVSDMPELEWESPFAQEMSFESEPATSFEWEEGPQWEEEAAQWEEEAPESEEETVLDTANETAFMQFDQFIESEIDVAKAAHNNKEYSQKLLWHFFEYDILQLLGYTSSTPGPEDFARAVAKWQSENDLPGTADGILGPTTWTLMFKDIIKKSSFPNIDIDKAAVANRKLATTAGWESYRYALYKMLGFHNESPDETLLVKAIVLWQRKLGFTGSNADGRLGQNSWDKFKPYVLDMSRDTGTVSEKPMSYPAVVRAPKGIYLHKKPHPGTKQTTKLYAQGEKVTALAVSTNAAEWGWVKIRTADADEGWIEDRYIIRMIPDEVIKGLAKDPIPYMVKPNDTLDDLVKKYYPNYAIEIGNDRRTIIHAFSILNDGQKALYYSGDTDTWWRDHVLDRDMAETRKIYQTLKLRANLPIYFPNEAYIQILRDKKIVGVRPDWKNTAITIGKAILGFLEGIAKGFVGAGIDTITGLWDAIKSLFTGELFKQVYNICKEFIEAPLDTLSKVWDFIKTIIGDKITQIKNDFYSQDPYRKFMTIGKMIGYILFEVVLALLTMGGSVAVKLGIKGIKALELLDKFITLKKIVNKAKPMLTTTVKTFDKFEDVVGLIAIGDAALQFINNIEDISIEGVELSPDEPTKEAFWEPEWDVQTEEEDKLSKSRGDKGEALIIELIKNGDPDLVKQGIPAMGDVIEGQYNKSRHGIDIIGFTVDKGKVRLYIIEVKGGTHPSLPIRRSGQQAGGLWVANAIDKLMKNPEKREKLIAAFKDYYGRRLTLDEMRTKLMRANRRVVISKESMPYAVKALKASLKRHYMRRLKLVTREVEEFVEINNEDGPTASNILSPAANASATKTNVQQVARCGYDFILILSVLRLYVNEGIVRQLLSSGGYTVAPLGSNAVDSVFTECIHQFQIMHFINTKEHDGIMGASTLDTLGFIKNGLRAKLNSSGFYGQKQLNRSDVKPLIPSETNNEFSAENWYQHIIKPAWLGVKISDGIHVLLWRELQKAQLWLMQQPQYRGMRAAALGKAIGFTANTSFSGARLSAKKQAMHGFGLAIDINVFGNPWIGAGWVKHDPELLKERTRMIEALRKAANDPSLPGSTVFAYLHSISQRNGSDTRATYNELKKRNDEFIAYLRSNSSELSYWNKSQSFGSRNPLNGFLNLHTDLVYALRHVAGLAWGAVDFGPKASGDIMHFDLRTIGVGKILCDKIGGYVPSGGHPMITTETQFEELSYDGETDEFIDESELHEAIEEAEWQDEDETVETESWLMETQWETEPETDGETLEHCTPEREHLYAQQESFYDEVETQVKDWSAAVSANRKYAAKLGWGQYITEINDLLLPYSGMSNVSLGEEAMAEAIAAWQRSQGLVDDGIMGPNTWNKMKLLLPSPAVTTTPYTPSGPAPSTHNVFDFNKWHAQKILDCMNQGIIGQYFGSKEQLEKIVSGQKVLNVNPNTQIIQSLPVMSHIADSARNDNYNEIIFGSFIRGASSDGKCTGHCAGRCIDINHNRGSFESNESVQMVIRILQYLQVLPSQYRKSMGFGLPLQGSFFGKKNLTKFVSTSPSNLIDSQLKQLIPSLGIVFPDNDNHLHIQVRWM